MIIDKNLFKKKSFKIQSFKDGLGRAKKIWICKHCNTWHEQIKPSQCHSCQSVIFEYCASKAEARRYSELIFLQSRGLIQKLKTQVTYYLKVNDINITTYRADFVYYIDDVLHVEDVKGYTNQKNLLPESFLIKQKLMKACHNIDVKVIEMTGENYGNQ